MTAIYVIAALLVVLFLFGAYRMMGAGAAVDEDPRAVLMTVLGTATEAAESVDTARSPAERAAAAHDARRRLEGCAQALERIGAIPVDVTLDRARTALERAVDELSWSARLAEAPGSARDDALVDAATALHARGTANLADARGLLDG